MKTVAKFRNDNRTLLTISPGLSSDGTVVANASRAYMEGGKVYIDINALSNRSNTTGVLRISGFKSTVRVVDASYISKVACAGVIRVFKGSIASVGTMLNIATNQPANLITRPATFYSASTIIAAGGSISIKANKKAGKGILILDVVPY